MRRGCRGADGRTRLVQRDHNERSRGMTMTHEDVAPGVRLRGYRRGDEERVLALWQLCLPTDPIAREVFIARILLDVNFEPDSFIVAQAGDDVVGFLYAAVRATPMYRDDFE